MENKETFSYTYSAKEQEEIKKIQENMCRKSLTKWNSFAVWMQV